MLPNERLSVRVAVTKREVDALARASAPPVRHAGMLMLYWPLRGALLISVVAAAAVAPIAWVALIATIGILAIEWSSQRDRRAHPRDFDATYEVHDDGLHRVSRHVTSTIAWTAINEATVGHQHVVIRLDRAALAIPRGCFTSDAHRDQFVAAVVRHRDDRRALA